MRHLVLSGLLCVALPGLLGGCAYVSSPFDGFAGFIGDTHTFGGNPNRPLGTSDNLLRAQGQPVASTPLLPEPGNVWPGPTPPSPTLSDLEKEQNQASPGTGNDALTGPATPRAPARGSSTPPAAISPGLPPLPGGAAPLSAAPSQPAPRGRSFQTPAGPAVGQDSGNGLQTFTAPGGGQGIVVPNGNGTSTLIGPDGTITTVPTPK